MLLLFILLLLFFFNDTATTEIYTLSLHDALPILLDVRLDGVGHVGEPPAGPALLDGQLETLARDVEQDRKSTRLNSSHLGISYAVFCLKKKNKTYRNEYQSEERY